MRTKLLALAFAGLTLLPVGCRSHLHAGGGQGFDAGASIGPRQEYYGPPVVVQTPPPPPATIDVPQPMSPK